MCNAHFLTDDYGVPAEEAARLFQWAREQPVKIPNGAPMTEAAYQQALLLIRRVKALGYRHRNDRVGMKVAS